jgi:CheY-like chemotaxis protein
MRGTGGIDAGIFTTTRLRGRGHESHIAMNTDRVLILEDSLIIAMEAEEILRETGARTVDIVSNMDQAIDAINAEPYDFALLDVNLGQQMSFNFARLLVERRIPFGFVSGYSNTQDFPEDLQHLPLLVKPFSEEAMRDFIAKLSVSDK